MGPLDLVGVPDWRSAVLAVAFAAPWLALLAGSRLRNSWTWVAAAVAALLFPLSIAWVQVPIQQAIGALWQRALPMETINRYILLTGLPSVAVSGLVQETVKFGVAALGLRLTRGRHLPQAGLALGAAAGAGYGAMEAFWVFNLIFAAGFSWGMVQLGGLWALVGFGERFFAVMFHVAAAALAGYGLVTGRPWRYLLLAIGLHTAVNYSVLLLQAQVLGPLAVEILGALIAVTALSAALSIRAKHGRRAVGGSAAAA